MITDQVVYARGGIEIFDDGGSLPVLIDGSGATAAGETFEAVPVVPIVLQPKSPTIGGGLTVNTPPVSQAPAPSIVYATPQQQPAQEPTGRRGMAESSLIAGEAPERSSAADVVLEDSSAIRRVLWLLFWLIVAYILARALRAN